VRSFVIIAITLVLLIGCGPADQAVQDEPAVDTEATNVQPPVPTMDPENDPKLKELIKKSAAIVYPGATFPDGKSNIRKVDYQTRYELVMQTKDDPRKVAHFYQEKMHLEATEARLGPTLLGMTKDDVYVMIVVTRDEGVSSINYVGIVMDPDAPKTPDEAKRREKSKK
jgi:hypothetical protein